MRAEVWIWSCAVLLVVGGASGIHGMLAYSFPSLLLLILFLGTALPVSRFIFGPGLSAPVFAFPIGFVFHGFILSLLGLFFGIQPITLILYISASVFLAWRLSKRASAAQWEFKIEDVRLLCLWILAALAVTLGAFFNVGRWTPEGFAYRAYFNADFFRNLAVAGSLSNSGIPPQNPYVAGQPLNYYWLFHSFLAYWKALFPGYRSDYMLVQFSMVVVCIFVSSMFIALRRFVSSKKTLVLVLLLFLFGGSYKGPYILWNLIHHGLPLNTFASWNVEGILRWQWKAPQIDIVYRAFLYAPQHLIALSLLFPLLIIWTGTSTRAGRFVVYGIQLASVGFSVFLGGMLALFTLGVLLSHAIVRKRGGWLELGLFALFGVLALAVYVKVFRMFPLESSSLLQFGLDRAIRSHFAAYTLLNWGALFPLAVAGLILRPPAFPLRLLGPFLFISILLIYCAHLNLPGGSDISLKVGYLCSVLLLFFAAAFLERILTQDNRRWRWIAAVATVLLLVPAAVTWIMEEFNSVDITNTQFTTFISSDDWGALEWMKSKLPPEAVVQYVPSGKGYLNEFVTEVPPLAEHAVFLGDKNFTALFQTPQDILDMRSGVLSSLFNNESPAGIYEACRTHNIDTIFLSSRVSDASFDFRQQLIEPYFTTMYQRGKTVVISRDHGIKVRAADLDNTVLTEENQRPILSARYGRNLYAAENEIGVGSARWMSNHAEIALNAQKSLTGTLQFAALAFARARNLEIYLNDERLYDQAVSPKGTAISVPLILKSGPNMLRLDCVEGPERADTYARNGDMRRVSIRLYRLRFVEVASNGSELHR